MTPLLVLVIALSFPSIGAQVPKPITTELEGTWREPLLPGEKPADRLVVTIKGEDVTVVWYDGVFRGTLLTSSFREREISYSSISSIDEMGEKQRRTHSCRWLLHDNQLFLEVSPIRRVDQSDRRLDLALVTFRLERVKK